MNKNFLAVSMVAALAVSMIAVSCNEPEQPVNPVTGGGNVWTGTELKGNVTGQVSLDASKIYTLTAPLYVTEGAEFTIPAGTRIEAIEGFDSYILVLQGGKIHINGTAAAPVVMTGKTKTSGSWGGLIINGRGTLAGGQTNVDTEINAEYKYGGTIANDNSGTINYLVLEYPGAKNTADVEHNGFTLNGVGSGTSVSNVLILESADDGIEFFGGSVDVTNLLVINSDDDMFDFTRGYNGTLKNAYGLWEPDYLTSETDPSGIEADGNFDGNFSDHAGQSDFRVENITFDIRQTGCEMQTVMMIRRGAKATVTNALVKGSGKAQTLINFTNSKGNGNEGSAISLTNALTTAPDNQITPATGYPGATIGGNNTGCPTSIFGWTEYEF